MGFKNGAIATIWKVKESDGESKFRDVQISTSRKNKKTEELESDFSGYVRFVAGAVTGVEDLKEKDHIVLKNVDVNRKYDKKRGKEFVNFVVFGWEKLPTKPQNKTSLATDEVKNENITHEQVQEEESPFE